jgi:integrase
MSKCVVSVTPVLPQKEYQMARGLTVLSVESAKPKAKRHEISDGGSGLYLVVQPSGAKSWALRYRTGSRTRKFTLGNYPKLGLVEARKAARSAMQSVAEGEDPADKKAARRASDLPQTIDELAVIFIERYAKKNCRPRTCQETARILGLEDDSEEPGKLRRTKSGGDVLKKWKGRRLESIKRGDVIKLLDDIASEHAVHANRVLAALRRMFNWAIERDLMEASPCAQVKAPSQETSRDRVLSDEELGLVLRAARKLEAPFCPYVQMLTLTLQRRNEVAGMRWCEINWEQKIWVLPASRTKNGNEHIVPLSSQALQILETLKETKVAGTEFVFTTTGRSAVSGFSKVKKQIDRLIEAERGVQTAPWRFHDLRRSGNSKMPRLGVELAVCEKVLNHVSGTFSGVVGIYQRHAFLDEKRNALEKWAQFAEELPVITRDQGLKLLNQELSKVDPGVHVVNT